MDGETPGQGSWRGLIGGGCHCGVAIAHGLDDERGVSGTQMHILLREGYGNTVLAERLIDLQQQIIGGGRAILRTGHKARDFPLQGMLAKGTQEHRRGRCREHAWMAAHRLSEQAFHEVHVTTVGDAYW